MGAVVALMAVSVQFSDIGPAAAAGHPSAFVWTATVVRGSGGWEIDSPSGVYRAVYQTDHNLVVYHGTRAIWASGTANQADDSLVLTAGNFPNGPKGNVGVWVYCTTTCTHPPQKQWNNGVNNTASAHHLNMQNDGNFVEYTGSSGGNALWASNTVGK